MKEYILLIAIISLLLLLQQHHIHAGQFTWTGAIDTMYAQAGNWSGGSGVPGSNDTVFIVSAANRPVLAQDQDVYCIKMTSGARFDLKGFVFTTQDKAEMEGRHDTTLDA